MSQLQQYLLCDACCILTHFTVMWPLSLHNAPAWLDLCVQLLSVMALKLRA